MFIFDNHQAGALLWLISWRNQNKLYISLFPVTRISRNVKITWKPTLIKFWFLNKKCWWCPEVGNMIKLVVSINILTGVWYQVSWEISMLPMKSNIYLSWLVVTFQNLSSLLHPCHVRLGDGLHIMLNSFKYFQTRIWIQIFYNQTNMQQFNISQH